MSDHLYTQSSLRILTVAELWQGSDGYAYVRAFRRMGHSVKVIPSEHYVPTAWSRKPLRVLRHLFEPIFVREYSEALVSEARRFRPHLFFVFKGRYVTAEVVKAIQDLGATAINFYPDVSFMAHGKYIPQALPVYDWVFTTKTFGITDMGRLLGVRSASFLPHSYDPEVHFPIELDDEDRATYECDVSFIGTWSPKKQRILEQVCSALPSIRLRIWGAQWEPARATLGSRIQGHGVIGLEYTKALVASRINLAILSEARKGASSGDCITSRTFDIPATGGFMLHERTDELLEYFEEGTECECFGTPEELVDKIVYYLVQDEKRQAIAAAGRQRTMKSGYAIDDRVYDVLKKFVEIHTAKRRKLPVAIHRASEGGPELVVDRKL